MACKNFSGLGHRFFRESEFRDPGSGVSESADSLVPEEVAVLIV